jgi:hypothetical protein
MMRSSVSTAFGTVVLSTALLAQQPAVSPPTAPPQAAAVEKAKAPALSDEEMERFLLKAKVGKTKGIKKGVTGSLQATLTDGKITHDAHIQTVDERKQQFVGDKGGVEFDFRDSWEFNIAGYRIDRLIGMNLVPVSVQRNHGYSPAAFTWWLDDVKMDEEERLARKKANEKAKEEQKKEAEPPDVEKWNQQMQMVRVFDELIGNVDRNLGNLVITNDWRVWPIDHTRAFRTNKQLKTPANVTRADRAVFERMKALDKETLKKAVGKHLSTFQIDAILARRDAIVKRLEGLGPSALYDRTGW